MSSGQDRYIYAATLLADSAWAYALLGVVGVAFGEDGSPLGWATVLALLVVSLAVTRALQLIVMPAVMALALEMALAAVAIYATIATQVPDGAPGFDLLWLGHLAAPDRPGFTFAAVAGALAGAALWWRAGRLVAATNPGDHLLVSFRVGLLALGLAAVVDAFHPADLNVYAAMLLFFASALAGLALTRLLQPSPQAAQARTWHRVIGGLVATVLFGGLLLSVVQSALLPALSRVAGAVAGFLAEWVFRVVFFVLVYPFAFVAGLLIDLLIRLLRREEPPRPQEEAPVDTVSDMIRGLRERALDADAGPPLFLQVLEWALVAAIAIGVLILLASAFRRRIRYRGAPAQGVRESLRDGADPGRDWARLFLGLLPRRPRAQGGRARYRLPEGPPEVVDVFRLYFGMLELARARGLERAPTDTPDDMAPRLAGILPPDLVRAATHAFVRACYGHHPAAPAQIAEMRSTLTALAAGPG